MMEVYKRAEKLGLDIVAEAYNVLIFTMNCDEDFSGQRDEYSSWEAESLELLENFFADHSSAMLFRSNIFPMVYFLRDREKLLKKIQERVWMRSVRF